MNELTPADRKHRAAAVAVAVTLQTAEQACRRILADQPAHVRALCGLAAIRGRLGARDEARDLIARAVAVAGPSAEDYVLLGTTFIRIRDFASAQRQFEMAVARDERHAEARFHLAHILCGRGDVAGAVIQYETLLAIDPHHAQAHQNLGLALQRLGRFEAAVAHHQAALRISPGSAAIHLRLGDALRHLGRYDDAITQYAQALASDPGSTDAHVNLGGCFHATGRHDQAIHSYRRALTIDPGLADACYNLGNLYAELGDTDAAIGHYERRIALPPASADAHNNLANALQQRGRSEDAIAHYQDAIRLAPSHVAARRNLGDLLQSQNRIDEAILCFRAATEIAPADATLLNRLASALLIAGRLDDASRAYEKAIDLAPDNVGILHNHAGVKPFSDGDRRLARLEDLYAREDQLSGEERIVLHFTLGRAYADLSNAERSFHHLHAGNRLKRQHVSYDERETSRSMQRIRDVFTRELLTERCNVGHDSQAPVFVIGMPRSGTSLVEQILASHPRVLGAGEVDHFASATADIAKRRPSAYPDVIAEIPDEDLRELGKSYVQRLSSNGAAKDRIIDKLPANFLFAGLIHLALPRARIIHVSRNAVDTCVSCYSLLFAEDQPFAYDLGELGRYYREYDALMRHWRSVLPPARMLEVRYEDLVQDLESQARRLVAHCGVEWDQRCLAFHETRRPVHTASLVQVRKSIYNSSVGRSQFYGSRLRPLTDALGIDGDIVEEAISR